MTERMTAAEYKASQGKPVAKGDPLLGKVQSFSVPFPPSELSPNESGANKFKIARFKRSYRAKVCAELVKQKIRAMADEKISLEFTFYPPANYRYDDDGLVGRMKAGRDEIARFIGVDDRVFTIARPIIAPAEPPVGRVAITLRPAIVEVPIVGAAYPSKVVWK